MRHFRQLNIFRGPKQGFQNKPAAAGAPAGATTFTASYFVYYLKYQFCSPSSTLSFQVIFHQPGLLYSLFIFENDVIFLKPIIYLPS
jgi:hypothetical protein